jgi:hypothetical protein
MQFRLSIRSLDPNVRLEIPNGEIAKGITIRECMTIREIENPPIDFIVYVAEHYALPILATLTAKYLYDKLKDRKDKKIMINNQVVEINAKNIENQINIIVNQSKKENED